MATQVTDQYGNIFQGTIMKLGNMSSVTYNRMRRLGLSSPAAAGSIITLKKRAHEQAGKGYHIHEQNWGRLWNHDVLVINRPEDRKDTVDFLVITTFSSCGYKTLEKAMKRGQTAADDHRKFYCPIEGPSPANEKPGTNREHPDSPVDNPILKLDSQGQLERFSYAITQPVYSIDPQDLTSYSKPRHLNFDSLGHVMRLVHQHTGYRAQPTDQHRYPHHLMEEHTQGLVSLTAANAPKKGKSKTKKVISDLADNPIVQQSQSQRPPGASTDSVATRLATYAGGPSSNNPFRSLGLEQQNRLLEISDLLKDLDHDLFALALTRLRELEERFQREIYDVRMQIVGKARNIKETSELLEGVWTTE